MPATRSSQACCLFDIEKQFSTQWKNDDEDGGKNMFEEDFFKAQLKRLGKSNLRYSLYQGHQQPRRPKISG
jgi:hypothetical protein